MIKSILSNLTKHAGHVLLAGLLAYGTGLTDVIAHHIPTDVFSNVGITIDPGILATAILTGVTNALEKYIGGGK